MRKKRIITEIGDNFLSVAPECGQFLYMCSAFRAKRVVEFGYFLWRLDHLACALNDNGGGLLIGTELEPLKAEQARKNLADAG